MLRFLRGGNKRTKTIWWLLIFLTVVTFVGGFVFLLGSGINGRGQARAAGAIGTVNGQPITRQAFDMAMDEQRQSYKQRFGSDPTDRDAKNVELQAWRTVVTRMLLKQEALKNGLGVTDDEVVLALQTSPPAMLTTQTVFQTDGKFDPQKYSAALRDPNNNWAPFEALVRDELPVRKLQERLMSSVKLTDQELEQEFHERYDRVSATVAFVPGVTDSGVPQPTDADLQRTYEKYKTRFMGDGRTQLEMLIVPKKIGAEEIRTARETAQGLVDRARKGEDFAALVRDYSEGPATDNGGVVNRYIQPSELGPELGARAMAMKPGDVSDPVQDGSRFLIIKLVERVDPSKASATTPAGGLKIAQLVVKVRANEDALRDQFQTVSKLRQKATTIGLGRAAAEAGLATNTSEYYDMNSLPQALVNCPEAADWGTTAKKDAVSPVFEGIEEFVVVEVRVQQEPGAVPRDLVGDALRQLADMDNRVDRSKPKADALAAALASGHTLEQAASAQGITPMRIEGTTRRQPDPRVNPAPELVGLMFGTAPGKTVGPVRGINGWYFGRVESNTPADTSLFRQVSSQLRNDLLQRRQQTLFTSHIEGLRRQAKIEDLRTVNY